MNSFPEIMPIAAIESGVSAADPGSNGSSAAGYNPAAAAFHMGGDEGFKKDMRDLEDLLSKLNPMAEEFVPPSLANGAYFIDGGAVFGSFGDGNGFGNGGGAAVRRKKIGYSQGKRRMNSRTATAQREEAIRKTVYVSDIDQQVQRLRLLGDYHHSTRIAFVEFARGGALLTGQKKGFQHPEHYTITLLIRWMVVIWWSCRRQRELRQTGNTH